MQQHRFHIPYDRPDNALGARTGERFRLTARVEVITQRIGVVLILLADIRDAATGQILSDRLWFRAGAWSRTLQQGDHIAFTARVSEYLRWNRDCATGFPGEYSTDWRLVRPTAVIRLQR
jgi:hypothetical protein